MFGIGTTELVVIMLIVLILFGAKKLPELARGLGKGINEFKRASQEIQSELDINAPVKESKTTTEKKEEDNTSKSE